MKKKVSVPIKTFWYSDKIVWPKTVTIVTTVNEGVPNAAPLSGVIHYDNLSHQPRVMLMMRRFAHTIQNICKTGEFVVNFPPYELVHNKSIIITIIITSPVYYYAASHIVLQYKNIIRYYFYDD